MNIETCYNWQASDSLLFFKKDFRFKISFCYSNFEEEFIPFSFGNILNITPGQTEGNVVYQDKKNVIKPYSFAFKIFEI